MAAALSAFNKENMKVEQFEAEEMEEGEISDDEEMVQGEECDTKAAAANDSHETQSDTIQTDVTRRFALVGDLSLAVAKDELAALYASLGIDEENERHYRFNTVHMRGTRKMTTEDIYEYFSALAPAHVEWLEEGCNVEWYDEILPARALLYLSIEIKNLENRAKMDSDMYDSSSDCDIDPTAVSVDAFKLKFDIPPGKWRKGIPCDLSNEILMRYANKDDKKTIGRQRHERRHRHKSKKLKHKEIHVEEPQKNPWGDLAMTWGRGEGIERIGFAAAVPRNIPDLRTSLNDEIESRFVDNYLLRAVEKRRTQPPVIFPSSESDGSSEEDDDSLSRRRKLPRMHADKEEEKQKIKRIAQNSGDLRERLNLRKKVVSYHGASRREAPIRYTLAANDDSGDDLSLDWANENYRDFRKTVACREREDTEESESELELGDDEPGELLQIEIDNDRYREKKKHKH